MGLWAFVIVTSNCRSHIVSTSKIQYQKTFYGTKEKSELSNELVRGFIYQKYVRASSAKQSFMSVRALQLTNNLLIINTDMEAEMNYSH